MSHSFNVTTVNTHFARALKNPNDFAGSDILLLQEVLEITPEEVAKQLGRIGLRLAALNEEAGLAIALSDRFNLLTNDYHILQPRSNLAGLMEAAGLKPRLRERGLITANIHDTNEDRELVVATTCPIVCVRGIARARQVRTMTDVIRRRYATGILILGGDMNHYPGPNKVDDELAQKARLRRVSNEDATCLLEDTRHNWLRYLGIVDPRLDALLFRNLAEESSQTRAVQSDHRDIEATFSYLDVPVR